MFTHIVLFKLKDRDTAEKTRDVLLGMEGKIPELLQIEVGIDVLRSGRSYDVALITRHESLEGMQAYQVHPVHQEVIKYMSTVVESSVAADF